MHNAQRIGSEVVGELPLGVVDVGDGEEPPVEPEFGRQRRRSVHPMDGGPDTEPVGSGAERVAVNARHHPFDAPRLVLHDLFARHDEGVPEADAPPGCEPLESGRRIEFEIVALDQDARA